MLDFTNRVKKIINEYAPREAKRLGHEYLGPEHILLGLLKTQDSVAMKILTSLSIEAPMLKKEIERRTEAEGNTLLIDPSVKDKVQKLLEYAQEEARKLRHSYIGSEHLLLALLRETSSIAATALAAFNITYQIARNEINETLGIPQEGPSNFKQQKKEQARTPLLNEFGTDLVKKAMDKKIDPVIGRDKEIDRVVQILSRRNKNNPVLIGEAGVGKTAVVEGLAQRILEKRVPESLNSFRIYTIDMAALIAGTKYRGEFEDRIKKLIKEVKSSPEVILFIDELHTIIGAGAAEGAVDAANILKPALARGEIQMIGATTLREYKRYIERDTALERRFQKVIVDEPVVEDAMRILAGLRHNYEKHHGVKYTKEAIKAAVRLSKRFINDRYLPDKAIDILDEAGAKARLANAIVPENLKEMEREVVRLTRKKNEMVREQMYEKAAALRDEIVQLEEKLDNEMTSWRTSVKAEKISIHAEDIEKIISEWTGIPVQQLSESESARLLSIQDMLNAKIIGQSKAVEKISLSIKRARTGLKSSKRPVGTFIFLGPTGVGKTQLAKELAEFLFGSQEALIRFDMSEYMEPHSVAKFIGSPPGYVGYDEGGQLTERVRRKPFSIILFDEIEKAHRDIQNVLLQVLDEGELTDTSGRKVNFRETIVIMTSNLGATHLMKGGKVGFSSKEEKSASRYEQVDDELKRYFTPEFLNRIDEVILFDPLQPESVEKIVDIEINKVNENILHRDIFINLTEPVKKYLAEKGFDEKYGARPLTRVIESDIEDAVASLYLQGSVKPPAEITVSLVKEKLSFKSKHISESRLLELKEEYLKQENSIDDFWDELPEDGDVEVFVESGEPESVQA